MPFYVQRTVTVKKRVSRQKMFEFKMCQHVSENNKNSDTPLSMTSYNPYSNTKISISRFDLGHPVWLLLQYEVFVVFCLYLLS